MMKLKTEDAAYDMTEEDAENHLYNYQFTTPEQCIKQLKFYVEAYRQQKEGADFRLYSIRLRKNVSIATVVGVVLLCEGLVHLCFVLISGFSIFALVGFFMMSLILLKCIETMIVSIYSYGVHFERPKFQRYIEKHKIFTIQDEKNHCDVEIIKLKQMIEEVKRKTVEMSKTDGKYFDYQYVSKYAETKTCYFFDEHSKIVFAFGTLLLIWLFTFVVYTVVNTLGGLS